LSTILAAHWRFVFDNEKWHKLIRICNNWKAFNVKINVATKKFKQFTKMSLWRFFFCFVLIEIAEKQYCLFTLSHTHTHISSLYV
jgi:hypothetical protein